MTDMTYLKAIEAGVDIIDTAISPFGLGTSQPPTEPMVATLQGTEYDTGLRYRAIRRNCRLFQNHQRKIYSKWCS